MPFIGKDWRASGDLWIKTPNGWRKSVLLRQKLLENLSQSILLRFFHKRLSDNDCDITTPSFNQHPQVFLNKVGTRKAIAPELDEALLMMDLMPSVHDLRRVQFILSFAKLLVEKFADFSVQAQKTVVCILGELVCHCERTNMNSPVVRRLLITLEKILYSSRFIHFVNSPHFTSSTNLLALYKKRIEQCTTEISQTVAYPNSAINITNLPDDCLLAIASRLVDPYDVVRLGASCKRLKKVCEEPNIWQSLSELYFPPSDLIRIRASVSSDQGVPDWRHHCLRFYRPYRLMKTYADQPRLCQSCWCVFWKMSGLFDNKCLQFYNHLLS